MAPLASFATAPILAHSLGVTGRGELAGATAPLMLAVALATLGIPEALNFYVSQRPKVVRHALARSAKLVAVTGFVAGVVVALSASLIAPNDDNVAQLIRWSALAIVPAVLISAVRAVAAGQERWDLVARERFISAAFRFVAIAGLALGGALDTQASFIVLAAAPSIGGATYISILKSARKQDLPERLSSRELVSYGVRAWVGSVSGIILSRLDQVLMIPLSGPSELGYYAVAVSVSEVTLILSASVSSVVFSADARNPDDQRVGRAARIGTLLGAGVAVGIGAPMPAWLPGLFGQEFAAAVPAAAILFAAIVVGIPGSVAGSALSARGNPGLRSAALLVASGVNVTAVLVLVPEFGASGAAAATFLGSFVAGWSNVVLLRMVHGTPITEFVIFRRSDLTLLTRQAKRQLARLGV